VIGEKFPSGDLSDGANLSIEINVGHELIAVGQALLMLLAKMIASPPDVTPGSAVCMVHRYAQPPATW